VPGIVSDIKKEGVAEVGYPRIPLHAAHSMRTFYRLVDGELPQVTQPMLLLHSRTDHVVPPVDSARVLSRVSSTDVTETVLEQSYHVATLDHDADRIFEESHAFVLRLAPAAGKGSEESKDSVGPGAGDVQVPHQSRQGDQVGQQEGTATGG
jgi:carboxylesterase